LNYTALSDWFPKRIICERVLWQLLTGFPATPFVSGNRRANFFTISLGKIDVNLLQEVLRDELHNVHISKIPIIRLLLHDRSANFWCVEILLKSNWSANPVNKSGFLVNEALLIGNDSVVALTAMCLAQAETRMNRYW